MSMSRMSLMLYSAYQRLWTLPTTIKDLSGRTVIITGANVGLGFEAAKTIYAMNPTRLILAVRSTYKGEDAKKEILASTTKHAPPGQARGTTQVDVWELDLASFESVKGFAQKCINELDRLDVLLENAGLATGKWTSTQDAWESTIQVNVLSTFMLATLLMPLMEKTAKLPTPVSASKMKPHLAILASDVHGIAVFTQQSQPHVLNALNDEAFFEPGDRYQTSKLLDVLLTRELSNHKMFQNGEVVLCSINPGFCRSELMREFPLLVRWILYSLYARTTQEGSKNLVWGVIEDKIYPGAYVSSCSTINPSRYVLSTDGAQMQKKLWKEVGDVIAKVAPETRSIWKQ